MERELNWVAVAATTPAADPIGIVAIYVAVAILGALLLLMWDASNPDEPRR